MTTNGKPNLPLAAGPDLAIKGVSVNLAAALFGNTKSGTAVNGTCGSLSNGHWAILSGSPDLAIARKALVSRTKRKDIDWSKPFSMQTEDPASVKEPAKSDTDVRQVCWRAYYGKSYLLCEDTFILHGDGHIGTLVAYTMMEWLGDDLLRPAREENNDPVEVCIDPQYYFAFRKLGFSFLVAPPVISFKEGREGEKERVSTPAIVLLVRENKNEEYELRGCLMAMKE